MIYVRGGNHWATPIWEKSVEQEVVEWTRMMQVRTVKMRTFKEETRLTLSRRLQRRLGLETPAVLLSVNGSVRLSSEERLEPLCILDV